MNIFEKFLSFLGGLTMTPPTSYGWFHLLCMGITVAFIVFFAIRRREPREKDLKLVLGIFGITAFILELLKQLVWSFSWDAEAGRAVWGYQWYAAPFQLCSMPIYASLIALFLKPGKVRDALLSFLAFFTILGSFATFFYPAQVFVDQILVNVHTMWLHCGALVVSMYLLLSKTVRPTAKNYLLGGLVFLIAIALAELMNVVFHLSGLTGGAEFNMFYVSPFFRSGLPIYGDLWDILPFPVFLLSYLGGIAIGSLLIFFITKFFSKLGKKSK